ncbi:energy-coupling factor transporter transmembrane component T [Paraclostridium bifermentans]
MKNSEFIDKMNPFLKIIILIVVTFIGSIEYKPFLPITLIVLGLVFVKLFSKLTVKELINSVRIFIIMSFGFMGFILLARYISKEPLMIMTIVGLGFKIMLISIYSAIFVKTTDPTEFVVSMIKYFKLPPKFAYAFLTAYRFIPTFKEEYDLIRHAYQVRGVSESKNIFLNIYNSKDYIIPMMATAVRKGIRISMAMETRAFGKYKTRTYYRKLVLHKNEIIASGVYIGLIISITIIYSMNNLTNIGFKFLG